MKKIIIITQLVLVCFLFNSPTYAQSEIDAHIAAFKSENGSDRRNAAKALRDLNDKRAVVPLIAALKDKNDLVKEYAADILGYLKDKRAVVPLIAALKDKDNNVYFRASAATALGELKDKRAVAPLTAALTETTTNAAAWSTKKVYKFRSAVRGALAEFSDM